MISKKLIAFVCCAISTVPNVCGQQPGDNNPSVQEIHRQLVPFATGRDDLWFVFHPSKISRSKLWSLANGTTWKRVETLYPAGMQKIETISILTSLATTQEFIDAVSANALSSFVPLPAEIRNPLNGSTLDEIHHVTRHSVLHNPDFAAVVRFHQPMSLDEMGQWLIAAPKWFEEFDGGPNDNPLHTQHWNDRKILFVDKKTAAVWQADDRTFVIASQSRLKNGLTDQPENDGSTNQWFAEITQPASAADISVTFQMSNFHNFLAQRPEDLGQFSSILQTKTGQLGLNLTGATLADLRLYFDTAKSAKKFQRKLTAGHAVLGLMLHGKLDQLESSGLGKTEQWLVKQAIKVYQSIKFSHHERAAIIELPRPENVIQMVTRFQQFQESLEKQQIELFQKSAESISEP